MSDKPTAKPSKATANYLSRCDQPEHATLAALEISARAFSREANSMIQQVSVWQRELRDAQFEEVDGHLIARMGNCDQRQKAMSVTLARIADDLQRLRVNITDLRNDQAEVKRCAGTETSESR